MRHSRRQFLLSAGALGTAAGLGIAQPWRRAAAAVARPPLNPLPGSAVDGHLVWNLEAVGYVSDEYLLSGTADVYESVSMADAVDMSKRNGAADFNNRNFNRTVVQAEVPYVTRIIVYRPRSAARFSGNVVSEVLHVGGGGMPAAFQTAQPSFIANGDVLMGVQHPASFEGVRAADPARYGSMSAVHPTQLWGMVRDAGRLVKEGGFAGLHSYRVRRQFLTGRSFTGVAAATFANFHHQHARLGNGAAAFDGYLPITSGYYVRPLDVPVIRINTLSEFALYGLGNRADDSDTVGSRLRLYEVAGACHYFPSAKLLAEAPKPRQPPARVAGTPQNDRAACLAGFGAGARQNDLPAHIFVAGAFDNLYRWSRDGIAPPRATRFVTTADGKPMLDASGNVLGGVRSPYVDLPLVTYGAGEGTCRNDGYARPLSVETLRAIHHSRSDYQARVAGLSAELVKQRWIRPEARQLLLDDASRAVDF